LRFNAQNLSFFRVSRLSCVDKVFHSFNLEKPASGVPLCGTKTKNSILRLKSAGEPSQRASQTSLFPTGGVYLKISELISLTGSAGGRAKTEPPFRPPRLEAEAKRQTAKEPERMSARTLFWPEADFSFS